MALSRSERLTPAAALPTGAACRPVPSSRLASDWLTVHKDRALSPWLIATGIVAALALILILGVGVGQGWGAPQWGPVAEWVAGAATFAAVAAALWQAVLARRASTRQLFEGRIDHEISRRRECIQALGDMWAGMVSLSIEFVAFRNYLDDIPEYFDPNAPRLQSTSSGDKIEPFVAEIARRVETFYNRWTQTVQPPLFVALVLLHGTPMYSEVVAINDGVTKVAREGFTVIQQTLNEGRRPDTGPIKDMWNAVLLRRNDHLRLAHQHFSLIRDDVERDLRSA